MTNLHSEKFPDCFYRVSVKGLCLVDEKVLLVKEPLELSGKWELPGGGLDFGEDMRDGLKREVEEELSLEVTSVSEQPAYAWTVKFDARRNMDWFYSFVVVYRIELANFDFKPSEECEAIDFFTEEDLQEVDLFKQSKPLCSYFKIADFH